MNNQIMNQFDANKDDRLDKEEFRNYILDCFKPSGKVKAWLRKQLNSFSTLINFQKVDKSE